MYPFPMEGKLAFALHLLPSRRDKTPFAVIALHDSGFIKIHAIPQFASHLFVHLIQAFAVVREIAAANLAAAWSAPISA